MTHERRKLGQLYDSDYQRRSDRQGRPDTPGKAHLRGPGSIFLSNAHFALKNQIFTTLLVDLCVNTFLLALFLVILVISIHHRVRTFTVHVT